MGFFSKIAKKVKSTVGKAAATARAKGAKPAPKRRGLFSRLKGRAQAASKTKKTTTAPKGRGKSYGKKGFSGLAGKMRQANKTKATSKRPTRGGTKRHSLGRGRARRGCK